MSNPTQARDTRGLYERAISAATMLVETRQPGIPELAEVALVLDEPVEKLHAQFADGRALLMASMEQALVVLIDSCTKAVVKVDPKDPMGQFLSLGDTYLAWVVSHPTQFRLMHDCPRMNIRNEPLLHRYLESLSDLTLRLLTRARDNGLLHPREDVGLLAFSSRCYVMGLARMLLSGRLDEWATDRDPLEAAKMMTADFVRRMARSSQPSTADL